MVRDKTNAEHYIWGDQCQGWRLVNEPGLSVIEEEMPEHTSEKLHFHKQAQQLFYILSGVAVIEVEGVHYEVKPGQSFHIKPGVVHCIFNRKDSLLRFLVISQPTTKGDRFEI
jgi:mannose-6-phosphate isomerase-like protein (cupin superfamily)